MTLFGDERIGLLEFQEGEKRGERKTEYLWHYNWGDNPPETFGWHGLLWYDRKNKKASKLIDTFCDSIDKAYPKRDVTFNYVKELAELFVNALSEEFKRIIIPFDPNQYYKNGLSDAEKIEQEIIAQRKNDSYDKTTH